MLKKEEKKVWDPEKFKWVIVKADGSRKDLYKTKKVKTKSKTKSNGNKARQRANKGNKRKGK